MTAACSTACTSLSKHGRLIHRGPFLPQLPHPRSHPRLFRRRIRRTGHRRPAFVVEGVVQDEPAPAELLERRHPRPLVPLLDRRRHRRQKRLHRRRGRTLGRRVHHRHVGAGRPRRPLVRRRVAAEDHELVREHRGHRHAAAVGVDRDGRAAVDGVDPAEQGPAARRHARRVVCVRAQLGEPDQLPRLLVDDQRVGEVVEVDAAVEARHFGGHRVGRRPRGRDEPALPAVGAEALGARAHALIGEEEPDLAAAAG
ncbi:hypothetical protein DFJ74DRAFT_193567 [Hyaloraphidium curvatum]|nr:hypothetical protein DFJ74DRAFT_193567 [Hyaloraphidium curvatum]